MKLYQVAALTAFFFLALSAQQAVAQNLQMECGPATGHVYTAAEGMYDKESAGWGTDGIPNAETIVVVDPVAKKIEYRWRDLGGEWHSAEEEGNHPNLLSFDDEDFSFQMLTRFEGNIVELCTFAEILDEQPKAICATSKNFSMITSTRVFVSNCTSNIIR